MMHPTEFRFFFSMGRRAPRPSRLPCPTLFRSVAAVLGGIGNVPGAMLGGLVLGLAEQIVSGYLSRSEDHTSELQSQSNLVCRLLLEKKKKTTPTDAARTATLFTARPHRSPSRY